jgi:hypothetical protein
VSCHEQRIAEDEKTPSLTNYFECSSGGAILREGPEVARL